MMPPMQALINGLVLALAAVSVCIWVAVFRVWRRDGSVLSFEPRRPVPWGPVGLVIAGVIFFLATVSGLLAPEDPPQPSQATTVAAILQDASLKLLVAGGVTAWLVMSRRATRADLGLPRTLHEGLSDFVLGVLAALAALVPVYVLLNIFVEIFGDRPQNPLLKRILEDPSGPMLAAAFVSAVIVAPIFEEFVFRLLVQGWLERMLVPARAFLGGKTLAGGTPETGLDAWAAADDDARVPGDGPMYAEPEVGEEPLAAEAGGPPEDVPIFWLPILISSLLFSSAHLGFEYGYSPIPLFLLAMILGYLYQRTHRILPCIAAHMLFNGISISMLWLQIPEAP